MTITYSPSTPTRLSNQAASLISPTPSAPLRLSPRFREFRKKERQARARVAQKELIKLKRAIRFAVNYYKKLENELRTANIIPTSTLPPKKHTTWNAPHPTLPLTPRPADHTAKLAVPIYTPDHPNVNAPTNYIHSFISLGICIKLSI